MYSHVDDSMQSLRRYANGVLFPNCVFVGGGVFKTWERVHAFASTDVITEWGSIETEMSGGNGGRDYYARYIEVGGVRILISTHNSKGIPNPGMAYVEKHAPEALRRHADFGKPLIINVSGKNVDDAVRLVKRALACGFKVIILNGACPNKGKQPVMCFDVDSVDELFDRLEAEVGALWNEALLWKVSAGMPRSILAHNKKRVAESNTFMGIVTCNTVPNTYDLLSDGRPAIETDNNITRGGMGGPAILSIALDHTQFCADGMPSNKTVIGMGGASDHKDALKHFRCGAKLVGVVSAFIEAHEDPKFIQDINLNLYEHWESQRQ